MSSERTTDGKLSLSAEAIAREALALVEEKGMEAFSFRQLGKRLGCEAMSIYHYHASKQHLIDAMVTLCLGEIEIPPDDLPARDWMAALAWNYRAAVLRRPGFALILTTHRLNHREGLAWLERVTKRMARGLPAARRATFFRVLSYYVTGAVIDEALGYAKGPGAAEPYPLEDAKRDFPMIMEMGAYFGPENHPKTFEAGLDALLDWYEREAESESEARRRA